MDSFQPAKAYSSIRSAAVDATFTVYVLGMHPAEFGNLAARYNLVNIAEACRKEADVFKLDGRNPASVRLVEAADADAAGVRRFHS